MAEKDIKNPTTQDITKLNHRRQQLHNILALI